MPGLDMWVLHVRSRLSLAPASAIVVLASSLAVAPCSGAASQELEVESMAVLVLVDLEDVEAVEVVGREKRALSRRWRRPLSLSEACLRCA